MLKNVHLLSRTNRERGGSVSVDLGPQSS